MRDGRPTDEIDRRNFLRSSTAAFTLAACSTRVPREGFAAPQYQVPELAGELGIVSASAHAQMTGRATGRHFTLLDLPKIMREELDMRVIDLNTTSFPDFQTVSENYLDQLRTVADENGCLLTNLKLNQRGFDMNSPEKETRKKALEEYKRSIDIAAHLGCRWARPLPGKNRPDMAIHVASYQELCDYGAERNVQLLVENFGWMQASADSVRQLVAAIGRNVAAGVDTGNWDSNEIRYAGLENSFPLAATCDFKARTITAEGHHPQYDLRRCFEIAWAAGFRGPWCFEHANRETQKLLQGFVWLRDRLREWLKEASVAS